jgi:hypothetical protein
VPGISFGVAVSQPVWVPAIGVPPAENESKTGSPASL